ncbi:MAG: hypothetical protein E6G36_11180 [Actinobacteria bacterium]|nr:MAG: hypothetical protein E6G36_11180 [Actinomycetota bacterium]
MARKHVDPLKAKQKKQKIVAAVLGVLFVGLLAFQVPRVMKQLHPSAPPAAAAATTTAAPAGGTPTLAAPTLAGSGQSPSTTGGSSDLSSATPTVQDGQLASFSLFASKDPFAQQLSDEKTSSTSGATSSPSGGSSSGSGSGSGSGAGVTGAKAPAPGSAVISVNGTLYSVAVDTDFPQASATDSSIVPLFHLVSLTAQSAKISIVGGSYANGVPTVTLTENKPVTLMNTADGVRYKLILKPVGTAVSSTPAPTSTSSTTVTVPPPSSP